ncbi:hypothetical protein GCM10010399_14070 [Dactylosporangium fulvum]|uniref:DUF1508 domain-containing protein n=1 Tax=Dactylosporangium fulvum TaxID=53359 RepID=A0ABY5W7E8_9ACTN|nr:hypothetical protein [Dactylosporangium fulvum]UWP85174.1 hypothetical protein Dfulv_13465 [Dactylosporangium fulvum]
MIAVVRDRRGGAVPWRLVRGTDAGGDVLAEVATVTRRSTTGVIEEDREGWRRAVERLRDGAGTLTVVATGDGHFRWRLTDTHMALIAASPAVYRDPGSCRRAFATARRAARAVVGDADRGAGS